MDKISAKITFKLDNGSTSNVTIKDLISTASESELTAVANKLIENRGQYMGSPFKSIVGITKITTVEEKF
ncbi:MAG: hypothetical protein FWC47_01665 [Oscillospiraceae bacterium]|nr:hypothetical protein [Oscillospiraceae bacterium]